MSKDVLDDLLDFTASSEVRVRLAQVLVALAGADGATANKVLDGASRAVQRIAVMPELVAEPSPANSTAISGSGMGNKSVLFQFQGDAPHERSWLIDGVPVAPELEVVPGYHVLKFKISP